MITSSSTKCFAHWSSDGFFRLIYVSTRQIWWSV